MKTLGQVAYDAYCSSRGWTAFNGDILPQYREMINDPSKQGLVDSWEVAALEVSREVFVRSGLLANTMDARLVAKTVLNDYLVYGDSYGVPTIKDVVSSLVDKIENLQTLADNNAPD